MCSFLWTEPQKAKFNVKSNKLNETGISMALNKGRRGSTEKKCQLERISSAIMEAHNLTLCRLNGQLLIPAK